MARGLIAPLMQLLQSLSRVIVCGVLALVLGACAAGPTAGLQSYQSPDGRFAFLYPTGWTEVQVSNGPRVVFHDLIHSDETVSLMINKVNEDNELSELGSAVAVGERLRREVIATAGSGRTAELVEAQEREVNGHTFYDLGIRRAPGRPRPPRVGDRGGGPRPALHPGHKRQRRPLGQGG